jgi:translation initiation factor IF-2
MVKKEEQQKKINLQPRPPVVVILGHVDHGKTTLLDYIRKSSVVEKESGGITQHIGAYQIEHQGKKITFIDTPGHEAFGAMRSRGASVADIAVLVVAAEEGAKPQTKEAILCIKKAGIPLVVAINKSDKPEADPEKVKRELSSLDVLVESWGGKVPSAEISAKTGQNVPELLDLILLVAEMESLKADFSLPAGGVVVESLMDPKRGSTATLLVREGTLNTGDIIGTASTFGKIKGLEDFQGEIVKKASPSAPCIATGFQEVPQVGEKFKIFSSLEEARKYKEIKEKKDQDREVFNLEEGQKALNLILKADVIGSLEAVEGILKNLPQEKVILRILKGGAGEVTEEDVKLAISSKAKIIGFRVKANPAARKWADQKNIRIINFDVIYDLSQAVRNLMEKSLEPETQRVNVGKMKVLEVFRTEKNRQIAGGKAIEGEIRPGLKIEVLRKEDGEEKIAGRGRIVNLQRNKKDIGKIEKGQECGILYEGEIKVQNGDILQFYFQEKKKGEL